MTVYVDDAKNPYRGFVMSHMMADSTGELLDMAEDLGLHPRWLQKVGLPDEHFDVSQSKRELAIRKGAQPVTQRDLVRLVRERRSSHAVD